MVVSADTTGGDFLIQLNDQEKTVETDAIDDEATRAILKSAITGSSLWESELWNFEGAGGAAEAGPLQKKPVGFNADVRHAWVVSTDDPNATITEKVTRPPQCTWGDEVWRDIGTGRGLMQVKKMKLVVRPNGRWILSYDVQNHTRSHRWVYKLDAIARDGQHLFTLVTPPSACKPNDRIHDVFQKGMSQEVAAYIDDIAYFVRRGAGQYRV